ncbi:hypothetical protein ACFQZC_37010 [Streptacidiphilus monticola]
MAVLTKETALLYLPAVVLLLWQYSDRRNRKFQLGLFATVFTVLVSAYPLFALLHNELLVGPGHVSLQGAIQWQLFDRRGSGSIFDPHSLARTVVHSWIVQDPGCRDSSSSPCCPRWSCAAPGPSRSPSPSRSSSCCAGVTCPIPTSSR